MLLATTAACGGTGTADVTALDDPTTTGPSPYKVVPVPALLAKPKPGAALPEPVAEQQHGGTYVAVYFAALDGPDGGVGYESYQNATKDLEEAEKQLAENFDGRYFGDGSTISNCDLGAEPALEAIGITSPVLYISLHFASGADAQQFMDGLDPPAMTMASVQTFCRD